MATNDAPAPVRPTQAEQLTFLYEARAAVSVLEASVELGILRRLEAGWVDGAGVATECGIDEAAALAVLPVLVNLGLAESDGRGVYRLAGCELGGFLELLRPWDGLADALRRGPGMAAAEDRPEDLYPRVVASLATLFAPAAAAAVAHLHGAGRRVLDLGAGAAPWTIPLVAQDPACLVTAVDRVSVVAVTRQAVSTAGCEDRFRFLGGDVFEVDFEPAAFDVVVMANLCHLFDESTNRRLLSRVARWLAPGGTVAVIDLLPNERHDDPRAVLLYSLGLIHRTTSGQVYPFSTYVGWLREAGFERVERIELTSYPPVTLVRSQKPGRRTGAED